MTSEGTSGEIKEGRYTDSHSSASADDSGRRAEETIPTPLVSEEEAFFQRPATPKQIQLLASAIEHVLSMNKKHLFTLQLSRRKGFVPDMNTPLVDRKGRLPSALVTPFDGMAAPSYAFEVYLTRVAKYTHAPPIHYLLAFVYMDRIACTPRSVFKCRFNQAVSKKGEVPSLEGHLQWWQDRVYLTPLNVHRMFLACFVVSVKYWSDRFFNNRIYGKVGGVHSEEMLTLELTTLLWLDFRLGITDNDYISKPVMPFIPEGSTAYLQSPDRLLPTLLCPTVIRMLRDNLSSNIPVESMMKELEAHEERVQENEWMGLRATLQTAQQSAEGRHLEWSDVVNESMTLRALVGLLSTSVFL